MIDFKEKIESAWEAYRRDKANEMYPNIMILGITRAGKSSLVNRIFGKKIASVSNVCPETKGFENIYYGKSYGLSVNIIDTAGYEMDQANTYYKEVNNCLLNGIKGETVHIVWYCIPICRERIEPMDIDILNRLIKEESIRKRLCIVLTKCDEDDENGSQAQLYRNILSNKLDRFVDVFETAADDKSLSLDLDKLISWSAESIDEEDLRQNFIASQFVDLTQKKKAANKIIGASAAAAAAAAAIPFPFADSAVLIPIQVAMTGKIISIYGVSAFASISGAIVGDVLISQMGRSLVKALLSWIPVLNAASLVVNAAVASSITSALGFAVSEICYNAVKKYLRGENVNFDEMFNERVIREYMDKFKKNGGQNE